MDITNINLGTFPLQYLSVGYVGETGARPVAFDFTAWAAEYGAGVLQLLLLRPGDAEPYPVLLDIDGTTATWTPDATATEKHGQGQAQLVYTVGGVIVKNAIFRVLIAPSLGAAGDPPEPYEDWLQRLTELAAETQQNAIDAAESAELAQQSAESAADSDAAAAQSAADAEAAKTGAEAAETAAGQSAAAAAEKAAQAAQAAQTAEQEAEDAQAASTAARLAADAAETFAENAESAEAGANQAKTDAERAADAAAVSATAADDAATQAEQSAQAAEQEASAAKQSAEDAQASETAAENAADAAGASRDVAALSASAAAQAKTDAETAATDAAASEASAAASAAVAQELIDQIPDIEAEIDGKAPAIYKTAGPAAVVTVTDGAEDMPIKTLTVEIPVTQSGSGDPAPENVRPFVARTAVAVTRTGESLIGGEALAESIMAGMPAATIDRTAQTVTFTGRTNGDSNKTIALIPLVDGQRYTAILRGRGNINNVRWQYTDGTYDTVSKLPSWGGAYVSTAGKTVRRLIKVNNSVNFTELNYGTSCILAGVKTAADFKPYTGETVDIDWTDVAGDVYGGTLTLYADGSAELAALPHYASYAGEALVGPWVSSMDVYAEGATPTIGAEVVDLGGAAAVYQLTAEQLRTLPGVNNLWSNVGTVTVEYPADTKSYVDAVRDDVDTLSGDVDALADDVDALADDVANTQSMIATVEENDTASNDYAVGDLLVFGGQLYKVVTAITLGSTIIPDGNIELTTVEQQIASSGGGAVDDVQINGTSIVADGVANVPIAMIPSSGNNPGNPGAVMLKQGAGISMNSNDHSLFLTYATSSGVKQGVNSFTPIMPVHQHESAFYGLAKIAGYDEKNSTLPAGQYTENAKSAIHEMLNGPVEVTGTTPVITALPGISYKCGEVATLDITLPANGIVDVVFESGTTPTVLTVAPPTGVTVRWANGFDPDALEANTVYEVNICDGLGVAAAWT